VADAWAAHDIFRAPGPWRDFAMLPYDYRLKIRARTLRRNPTDAELHLWHRLRRKQILGVQFYRQKTIGNYIVDFYAPAAKLVLEVDGGQHIESGQAKYDQLRTQYLEQQGLKFCVLMIERFCFKRNLCWRQYIKC
jgi:very-short-patch-repair endonuclease